MEEMSNAPVGQTDQASGKSESKDSVSYDSYQKVLKEKKSFQSRLDEQSKQLEELKILKEEKMKSEGKLHELLNQKDEELSKWKSQAESTKQKYAWNALTNSVKSRAERHNCKDPEGFLKLISDDDLNKITVADDFSVDTASLDSVFEDYKNKIPYMFDSARKPVANGNPSLKVETKKDDDIRKLSLAELKEKYKNSFK